MKDTISPASGKYAKLAKEIATAESALLTAEQLLRSARVFETLSAITLRQIDTAIAKLLSRQTPTLVELYNSDYDISASGGNMQGMQRLDVQIKKHIGKTKNTESTSNF